MTFDATPLDGSTPTPIPMASAVPTGTTTPLALEGGPAVSSGGNLLTPVSTYVKDGNNLVEGETADAAVTGDTAGTLSAKMRGLSKILADVWDSTNHRMKVDGSGVTQPVSGTVTANAGSGVFSNQQSNIQSDYDSGAGTQSLTMFGIALPASGGAVPGGTSATPFRTDPTGTTTQPVSGTFWQATQPVSIASMPSTPVTGIFWQATQPVSLATLPALVAGSALIGGVELVDSAGTNKASISAGGALKVDGSGVTQPVSGTFWQATQPVSIASMPSTPVTGTFWQATQPVSGTITANIGTTNGLALDTSVGKLTIAQGATLGSNVGPLVQGSVSTAAPAYTTGQISPLSLTPAGALRTDSSAVTQSVSGTFWQATQPVSIASMPSTPVTGTFWQVTQPVSGTVTANQGGTWNITNISGTVSLPTGAATSAKQPAFGTAGSASSDVLSVQGIASMTALKVDGSGVTQPVSGTFWQATQPVSIASMPSTPVTGTFWQATQPVSLAALPALTAGSAVIGHVINDAGTALIGYTGRSAVAVYSLASTTTVGATQNSGDLTVGLYTEIALDINVTAQAGTNPTLQFFYERKGADGIYYALWQTTSLTAATQVYTVSIGAGMNYAESLGSTGRLRWVVGGTATPTFTFSANITGK